MLSMDLDTTEKQFKFVVLGDVSSGKTSLITRYCHDEFSRQYYPTIGVNLFLKRATISGFVTRSIIWDISGNSLAGNLMDKYLYDADVVLLTYDITNSASFVSLPTWLSAVRTITTTDKPPLINIIANKYDIEHQRTTSMEKQNKFASEHGLTLHAVSARTGENVTLTFNKILAQLLGVKLSKAEQDASFKVMQAEVFVDRQNTIYTRPRTHSNLCNLQ